MKTISMILTFASVTVTCAAGGFAQAAVTPMSVSEMVDQVTYVAQNSPTSPTAGSPVSRNVIHPKRQELTQKLEEELCKEIHGTEQNQCIESARKVAQRLVEIVFDRELPTNASWKECVVYAIDGLLRQHLKRFVSNKYATLITFIFDMLADVRFVSHKDVTSA